MKYATLLVEGNKAAREIFSMFTNATSIDDIVYDQVRVMDDELQALATKLYTYDMSARDLARANGISDLDWVQCTAHRMNLAIFTTALWSNTDYAAATTTFFQVLIPKQLHARDDIIDVYMDVVARWAVVDIRHTIDKHTTRDVINKMKARINSDLRDEGRLLRRRVYDAFMKKYGHLDSTPLRDLRDIFDCTRVQKSWHKALPIVLEAIDTKMDLRHAEGSGIHNPVVIDEDEGSHDSTLKKPELAGQHFMDIDGGVHETSIHSFFSSSS